jgi:hypothetical protein
MSSSSSTAQSASSMPDGAVFVLVTPHRVFDSRNGTGMGGVASMIAPGSTTVIQATGSNVPAGAVGVVINLTYVNSTGDGYLTVYSAESTRPDTSNLNKIGPGPVANSVTTRLSPDGKIAIYNFGGATDLVGDVAGYYVPDVGEPGVSYNLPGSGGASGGSYLKLVTANSHAELDLTCNYGSPGDTEAFWFADDPSVVAGTIEITNIVDGYPMQAFKDLAYNSGGQDRAFATVADPANTQGTRPWHGLFTANEGGVLTQFDVIFTGTATGDCTAVVYTNGGGAGFVQQP